MTAVTDDTRAPQPLPESPMTRSGSRHDMSFEDRIRSTVDQAVAPLVQQLLEDAAAEREEAVRAAKVADLRGSRAGRADPRRRRRGARCARRWTRQIAQARAEDREAAAREIRQQLESEVDQKMHDALEAAENRMRMALADGEARAAEDLKAAVAAARVKEREIEMAGVSRLLESVRGLDGATSLSEVLDALALGRRARSRAGRGRGAARRSHPGLENVGLRPARLAAEIDRSAAGRIRRDRPRHRAPRVP